MFNEKFPTVSVLELIRYSHIFHPDRDLVTVAADDMLLVKGSVNDLVAILDQEDGGVALFGKRPFLRRGQE